MSAPSKGFYGARDMAHAAFEQGFQQTDIPGIIYGLQRARVEFSGVKSLGPTQGCVFGGAYSGFV